MTAWLIVPWGRRILISSWNPIRNPNDCMVNSLWYVEVTCSGYMICRSSMFWLTPYIYIEHKILVAVWHGTEFPGIYAILGLGKPRGLCVILYFTLFIFFAYVFLWKYQDFWGTHGAMAPGGHSGTSATLPHHPVRSTGLPREQGGAQEGTM